jgi:hypothetical protein
MAAWILLPSTTCPRIQIRNDEPLVRQRARMPRFADQTQLGEWLRKQSDASIAAFWQLIASPNDAGNDGEIEKLKRLVCSWVERDRRCARRRRGGNF